MHTALSLRYQREYRHYVIPDGIRKLQMFHNDMLYIMHSMMMVMMITMMMFMPFFLAIDKNGDMCACYSAFHGFRDFHPDTGNP